MSVKNFDEFMNELNAQKIDSDDIEKYLRESITSTEKNIIVDNKGRKRGDAVIINGKEASSSVILSVSDNHIDFIRKSKNLFNIYNLTLTEKSVVYIDQNDLSLLKDLK